MAQVVRHGHSRHGQGFNLDTVADRRGWRCPVSGVRAAYGLPHRLAALPPVMDASGGGVWAGTCARYAGGRTSTEVRRGPTLSESDTLRGRYDAAGG